jgi:predicted cupin superfamily sugar epimerase
MAPHLADLLQLEPHPEGGWYRETWRSPQHLTTADGRPRAAATLIHFLIPAGDASAWHRVASDEIWLAHRGTVTLELGGRGESPAGSERRVLGVDVAGEQSVQLVVPAGVWQRTLPTDDDALVSCVVSPGFDFEDFELA